MTDQRTYERTHPWISFKVDNSRLPAKVWLAFGEIQSKCEHIAGAPLRPEVQSHLHSIFLAKGLMATTAIEGNTLSEEEVGKRIAGELKLPPSKEYLGKEIDNVLNAANGLWDDVGKPLTVEDLKRYNSQILEGLKIEEPAVAGEIREHSVTVGRYLGAPAADCEYLLQKMCDWLNTDFKPIEGMNIVFGVMKAIFAHLYIAWIHPFGDGNGRTARMVEVRLLLEAGAPSSAAHLLSNYYNQTRTEYYRQLEYASKSGGDVLKFIEYACQGLCEQLREQISVIRGEHIEVTWSNYVHELFKSEKTATSRRRRMLALAISEHWEGVEFRDIRGLSPQIAEEYAGKTAKTIVRDLDALEDMEVIFSEARNYKPNIKKLSAFLPAVLPNGQPAISRLERVRAKSSSRTGAKAQRSEASASLKLAS